jgi:hypothetical protein
MEKQSFHFRRNSQGFCESAVTTKQEQDVSYISDRRRVIGKTGMLSWLIFPNGCAIHNQRANRGQRQRELSGNG